jgi:hypothetical protein
MKSGLEFVPDTVCVFDGLQHVTELCSAWFGAKLDAEKADELVRKEERRPKTEHAGKDVSSRITEFVSAPVPIPEGVELIEADAITDRKSVFVGHACRISHPSQVRAFQEFQLGI